MSELLICECEMDCTEGDTSSLWVTGWYCSSWVALDYFGDYFGTMLR